LRKISYQFGIHKEPTLNTPIEVLETRFPLRVTRYGLRRGSGGPGRPGRNLLNGRELPEKVALEVAAGNRLRIETPGGGGWGEVDRQGGV